MTSAIADFNPASIPGLISWVRSDSGITQSSGSVSSWADLAGSHNFTQGTGANQPSYVTNVYRGKPAVESANATSWLASTLAQASPITQMLVLSNASGLAYLADFNGGCGVVGNSAGNAFVWSNGSDSQVLAASAAPGLHFIVVSQIDGSSLKGYFDSGSPAFSVSPLSNIPGSLANLLGGNTGAGSNGNIVEYACFNRQLLDVEIGRLHYYCQNFWGVT